MGERVLTVYGQSAYNYKETPTIHLQGKWLEALGFKIGNKVVVEENPDRLVITIITETPQTNIKKSKKV